MDMNTNMDMRDNANRENVLSWPLGSAQHRVSSWLKQWRVWQQQAKTRRCLSQLPDHLLRDIGLHQTDLRQARESHQSTDFLHRLF